MTNDLGLDLSLFQSLLFLRKLTRRSKGPFDRRRDTRFITSKEKRVESKTRTDGDAGRSGFFPRLNSLLDPPQQVELGCDQQRTNERRGAILAGLDNEQRSASKPISPQQTWSSHRLSLCAKLLHYLSTSSVFEMRLHHYWLCGEQFPRRFQL